MTQPQMKLFVPITKIDAARRLVYGILAREEPDHSGEIFDYATSKPYFERWSASLDKATNGKSKGNMRAMHGKVAAGKFTDVSFNDADKQIEVIGKVVDDAEWKKVEEGVYTGFSIGGNYVGPMWNDVATGLKRYTANPVEGSLVDLPCMPGAVFTAIKADGSQEIRKFVSVQDEAEQAQAEEEEEDEVSKKAAAGAGAEQELTPAQQTEQLMKAAIEQEAAELDMALPASSDDAQAEVEAGDIEKAADPDPHTRDMAAASPEDADQAEQAADDEEDAQDDGADEAAEGEPADTKKEAAITLSEDALTKAIGAAVEAVLAKLMPPAPVHTDAEGDTGNIDATEAEADLTQAEERDAEDLAEKDADVEEAAEGAVAKDEDVEEAAGDYMGQAATPTMTKAADTDTEGEEEESADTGAALRKMQTALNDLAGEQGQQLEKVLSKLQEREEQLSKAVERQAQLEAQIQALEKRMDEPAPGGPVLTTEAFVKKYGRSATAVEKSLLADAAMGSDGQGASNPAFVEIIALQKAQAEETDPQMRMRLGEMIFEKSLKSGFNGQAR